MYTKLVNAVNDLEAKMAVLDDKDNNGCFMDKWRNGRAASSAENLTKVLAQVTPNVKKGKNLGELTATLQKAKGLFKKYNTMRNSTGFDRTFLFCFGRKSNTKAKLKEALISLKTLKKIAEEKTKEIAQAKKEASKTWEAEKCLYDPDENEDQASEQRPAVSVDEDITVRTILVHPHGNQVGSTVMPKKQFQSEVREHQTSRRRDPSAVRAANERALKEYELELTVAQQQRAIKMQSSSPLSRPRESFAPSSTPKLMPPTVIANTPQFHSLAKPVTVSSEIHKVDLNEGSSMLQTANLSHSTFLENSTDRGLLPIDRNNLRNREKLECQHGILKL
jgi:hypothetical protein